MRAPAFQLLATAANDNKGQISLFAEPGLRVYRLTRLAGMARLQRLDLTLEPAGPLLVAPETVARPA